MNHLLTRSGILISALLLLAGHANAQSYTPDKNGYISDPKFKALIKSKGYDLMGTFRLIEEKPLLMYAPYFKNGRWGTINNQGKEVQMPVEDDNGGIRGDADSDGFVDDHRGYVHPSNADLKIFEKDGKTGLINQRTNTTILPAVYDEISLTDHKFVMVKLQEKWGVMSKTGEKISATQYDDKKSLGVWMKGAKTKTFNPIAVKKGDKWGLLSAEGKEVLSPRFDDIKSSWTLNSIVTTCLAGKWGLATGDGKELIAPKYGEIYDFNRKGLATVIMDKENRGTQGVIDSLGNELAKPIYRDISYPDSNIIALRTGIDLDQKVTLVNLKGVELSKKRYTIVGEFKNNIAYVMTADKGKTKSGYIDSRGNEIIKPIYDDISITRGSNFNVKLNGKYGVINIRQEFLIPIVYDYLQGISRSRTKDLYRAEKDGKKGVIGQSGRLLLPLLYDEIEEDRWKEGIFKVIRNGKEFLIDLYQNQYPKA